ncbi:MAG TPA: hypothetical protein VMW27_00360 [Thermoanaerobaculia bacterium]|nr:hypothetical protein [Thermoanaerobaculia bacterium]
MKKTLFFAGLVSGVVLSRWWRSLAKQGIKLGIQAGQTLSEIAREELGEAATEADQEMPPKEQPTGDDSR